MTMPDCVLCRRPVQDTAAYLCQGCQDQLTADLATLADLAPEANAVIARQTRGGPATAGSTAGREPPLPVDLAAAKVAWAVGNTLGTWARHVSETRGALIPPPHAPAGPLCAGSWGCRHHSCQAIYWRGVQPVGTTVAMWLATHVRWLAYRPEGEQAASELHQAARHLKRMVDTRPPVAYYGRCWEPDDAQPTGRCEGELYAPAHAALVRCPHCQLEYDTTARREWLLSQVNGLDATATEAARALAAFGLAVPVNTIRSWAHRGRLTVRGHDRHGDPTYRIGEVIALAEHVEIRRAHLADKAARQVTGKAS